MSSSSSAALSANVQEQLSGRVRYAAAAIFMQVLLGVIYSWSILRGPLAAWQGWTKAQTIAPYRYSLLTFAAGMIIAGFLQDRKGPRIVASIGGVLLGLGCLIASFNANSLDGLIWGYGVVAAIGVGFAYVTPIAVCVKWFPDRRGMIVGLAVMGFGFGPLLFGPLLEALIGKDVAQYGVTIPRTFLVLAGLLFVGVTGAAQFYRFPPAGWKPEGWTPPASQAKVSPRGPKEMLGTWQFYVLWLLYFLGTAVGLTAIGEASPLLQEMSKGGAMMSVGAALGVMSVFNGLGRLGWGAVSDRMGRRFAIYGMCAVSVLTCLVVLRTADSFGLLLLGLCLAAFAYGGYLALMPSLTADYFGAANVGANYGLMFTAWGLCGFFVPGYFAAILEAARKAGTMAEGYSTVFLQLAGIAVVGILLGTVLRPVAEKKA